jgi:hypothetical protein
MVGAQRYREEQNSSMDGLRSRVFMGLPAQNLSSISEEGLSDVKTALRIFNFAEGFSDKRGVASVAILGVCCVGTRSKFIKIDIKVKSYKDYPLFSQNVILSRTFHSKRTVTRYSCVKYAFDRQGFA